MSMNVVVVTIAITTILFIISKKKKSSSNNEEGFRNGFGHHSPWLYRRDNKFYYPYYKNNNSLRNKGKYYYDGIYSPYWKPEYRNRLSSSPWRLVGIAYSQSITDDSVYSLYKREDPNCYKVTNKKSGVSIQLNQKLSDKNGKTTIATTTQQMKELFSGDIIQIKGKESVGDFVVEIN